MSVALQLNDGHKAYGGQVLLAGADMTIHQGMKVGIVGRNGAGKSTLCRIILGQEELDSGDLVMAKGLQLAHLEQHDDFHDGETALDFLMRRSGQADWRCGQVAGRLAIAGPMLEQCPDALSGGWRTRLKLAAMLLAEPDILLLDEPTNFLDLRTQLLLQDFLAQWRGTLIIVSHDRGLLTACCDHTLQVVAGTLRLEPGTVNEVLARQAAEQARLARENANTQSKMRQLQRFIDHNRANANTASQARSKQKELDRLRLHQISGKQTAVQMRLPDIVPRDGLCAETSSLAIGYQGSAIANHIDLAIDRGEKVVVFGDNGQGKTTLLKTLAQALPAVSGTLRWTHGAELGIYAQHVYEGLLSNCGSGVGTVLAYLQSQAQDHHTIQQVESVAGSFLFSNQSMHKPIEVLSGGERARLVLAGLLLGPHTVLLLDEPTNHLDVETVAALGQALRQWAGTVICVTHDRDFAQALATAVIDVGGGSARRYDGGVEAWLWMVQQEAQTNEAAQPAGDIKVQPANKARNRERYEAQKQLRSLDQRLAKAQQRQDALQQKLNAAAANNDAELVHELAEQQALAAAQLNQLEEEWLVVSETLEQLG